MEASGYGKVILFGEHFVVYGVPAIAAATDDRTTAKVEKHQGSGVIINDMRPETPGYKAEKKDQQIQSLNIMLKAMNIDPASPLRITLGGDLIAASGRGASAASCVAMAKALAHHFRKKLTIDQINDLAYEGEKGYHGTPSGIDNSVSAYGGLIWFKKAEPNIIEKISIKEPVEMVIADTGLTTNTVRAVDGVRSRKEAEPERYKELFVRAEKLAHDARKALERSSMDEVGLLMDMNHELLQAIEVSCPELDRLVGIARKNGAMGAKMTGSGLGGNIIALTPGKELQKKVAMAIEREGFNTLKTRIGI